MSKIELVVDKTLAQYAPADMERMETQFKKLGLFRLKLPDELQKWASDFFPNLIER